MDVGTIYNSPLLNLFTYKIRNLRLKMSTDVPAV